MIATRHSTWTIRARPHALFVVCTSLLIASCFDRPSRLGAGLRILESLSAWDAASSDERREVANTVAILEPSFQFVRLERFRCGEEQHEVAIFLHAVSGMEFSLVPGSNEPKGPKGLRTAESPFLIARTECTRAAYQKVLRGDAPPNDTERQPINLVSWNDAVAFCDDAGLSLPTRQQWEIACRGGAASVWCFGNDEVQLAQFAWYNLAYPERGGRPHDVALKRPNGIGLFDVHGNVDEWCSDGADPYPGAPPDRLGASSAPYRVVAGGGVDDGPRSVACSSSMVASPAMASVTRGFRPSKSFSTH